MKVPKKIVEKYFSFSNMVRFPFFVLVFACQSYVKNEWLSNVRVTV